MVSTQISKQANSCFKTQRSKVSAKRVSGGHEGNTIKTSPTIKTISKIKTTPKMKTTAKMKTVPKRKMIPKVKMGGEGSSPAKPYACL